MNDNTHALGCECKTCELEWEDLLETPEYGECAEFDDECEAELDSHFDRDGW